MGGVRRDVSLGVEHFCREVLVDTEYPEYPVERLHDDVNKYATVFEAVAPEISLSDVPRWEVEQP